MRVLIVDDEAGIREVLKRWLVLAGFETAEARDSTEALAVLDSDRHTDVALVDLHMPGPGGLWLVEQIRAKHSHVAVVLATADTEVPGTISLQPGVVGYLVKPFTAASVQTAMASASAWLAAQPPTAPSATLDPVEDWLSRAKGLRADKPKPTF